MLQSHRMRAAGAVAVWTVVGIGVGVGAQGPPKEPAAIRYNGRVVEAFTGELLPGVEVTCTTAAGAVYRAKTDDKGAYALSSAIGPTGACEIIEFSLDSFKSESFRYPSRGVLDVSLNVGSLVNWGTIAALPRAVVVDADGRPAVDASVWLWRIGGAYTGGWRTGSDGTFEMPFLADYPGDYALCARGAGERQRAACLVLDASERSGDLGPRLRLPPPSK